MPTKARLATSPPPPGTALQMTGGGARAAYQVGVLRGVMEIHGRDQLPFDVICGTSAGAINAVFMAANAHRPRDGVERLYRAWRGISAGDVYDHGWGAWGGTRWASAGAARAAHCVPRRRGTADGQKSSVASTRIVSCGLPTAS